MGAIISRFISSVLGPKAITYTPLPPLASLQRRAKPRQLLPPSPSREMTISRPVRSPKPIKPRSPPSEPSFTNQLRRLENPIARSQAGVSKPFLTWAECDRIRESKQTASLKLKAIESRGKFRTPAYSWHNGGQRRASPPHNAIPTSYKTFNMNFPTAVCTVSPKPIIAPAEPIMAQAAIMAPGPIMTPEPIMPPEPIMAPAAPVMIPEQTPPAPIMPIMAPIKARAAKVESECRGKIRKASLEFEIEDSKIFKRKKTEPPSSGPPRLPPSKVLFGLSTRAVSLPKLKSLKKRLHGVRRKNNPLPQVPVVQEAFKVVDAHNDSVDCALIKITEDASPTLNDCVQGDDLEMEDSVVVLVPEYLQRDSVIEVASMVSMQTLHNGEQMYHPSYPAETMNQEYMGIPFDAKMESKVEMYTQAPNVIAEQQHNEGSILGIKWPQPTQTSFIEQQHNEGLIFGIRWPEPTPPLGLKLSSGAKQIEKPKAVVVRSQQEYLKQKRVNFLSHETEERVAILSEEETVGEKEVSRELTMRVLSQEEGKGAGMPSEQKKTGEKEVSQKQASGAIQLSQKEATGAVLPSQGVGKQVVLPIKEEPTGEQEVSQERKAGVVHGPPQEEGQEEGQGVVMPSKEMEPGVLQPTHEEEANTEIIPTNATEVREEQISNKPKGREEPSKQPEVRRGLCSDESETEEEPCNGSPNLAARTEIGSSETIDVLHAEKAEGTIVSAILKQEEVIVSKAKQEVSDSMQQPFSNISQCSEEPITGSTHKEARLKSVQPTVTQSVAIEDPLREAVISRDNTSNIDGRKTWQLISAVGNMGLSTASTPGSPSNTSSSIPTPPTTTLFFSSNTASDTEDSDAEPEPPNSDDEEDIRPRPMRAKMPLGELVSNETPFQIFEDESGDYGDGARPGIIEGTGFWSDAEESTDGEDQDGDIEDLLQEEQDEDFVEKENDPNPGRAMWDR